MPSPELARRRARLRARIDSKFSVVEEPIQLGAVELTFTRVEDPDRVLDEVAAAEDRRERDAQRRLATEELQLPYWAELWDSAVGMARWIAGGALGDLSSATVLDLGCGMGLSGTAALARGARVTFADLEPAALLFARLNSLPWFNRARARRLDWRTADLRQKFDHILGADILYERAQWEHLDRFWRRHIADDGQIHLGEPGRQTGELFVTWAREDGWELSESNQAVQTRPRPIRIFTLRKRP